MAAGFAKPETFPKQAELSIDTPYGNYVRGPGRHHKRNHWSRIYDSASNAWLEGRPPSADSSRSLVTTLTTDRHAPRSQPPEGRAKARDKGFSPRTFPDIRKGQGF